jgi:hypothetical protein
MTVAATGGKNEPMTWHKIWKKLSAVGVDKLSSTQRALRRLPIADVQTCESLFQPRQLEGTEDAGMEASRSGRHLGELQRVLRDQGRLAPITVVKIQGRWTCCDGYHRLMAYRAEAARRKQLQQGERGHRLTHVPVTVFGGSLKEAFQLSVAENSQDKLNMNEGEKMEATWRRVILGLDTDEITAATTIGERTVRRMRKLLTDARAKRADIDWAEWAYVDVKRASLNWDQPEKPDEQWMEKRAGQWARAIAKHFNGAPLKHPTIFARALVLYDKQLAKDVAEQITFLNRPEGGHDF